MWDDDVRQKELSRKSHLHIRRSLLAINGTWFDSDRGARFAEEVRHEADHGIMPIAERRGGQHLARQEVIITHTRDRLAAFTEER
jgi:hypothetical protein